MLIKNFIKDRIFVIAIFALNSVLLIAFFNLINPQKMDMFYPTVVSLFMLCLLLFIEGFRYYKFNYNLIQAAEDNDYNLKPITCEQRLINKILSTINVNCKTEINRIRSSYEEKSHFLSQWVHNLKTPISVIDLIIQKYDSQEYIPQRVLKDIDTENNTLLFNVEQVLNVIRLESFEKDYEARQIDLIETIKEVINEKKNQFIYNKVFPVINTEEASAYVISDSKWNRVILEQVISNAIKYSAAIDQSKRIFFTITKDEEYTYLSIKDEGIGIAHYDLSRVFQPFFTGENGRNFRGSTGIGLYICKKVGEKLGHKIEIKSEVNKGTEVIIRYLSKL
ncbi:MAG: sensor histidine kinase [Bacillota bacterium]|nr:sensor histidine kinase [Bacillota bacterium]